MKFLTHAYKLLSFAVLLGCAIACDSTSENKYLKKFIIDKSALLSHVSLDASVKDLVPQIDSVKIDFTSVTATQDSTMNYVYLTFDDGPYKGSEKINKIIKEEQVKATVFVVGMNAYTKTLQQYMKDYEENDLIEISNHTYSHAHRNKFKQYYNHPEWVLEDVKKNDSMYGFKNRFVRLPGRNVWRLGSDIKNDYDTASKISSDLLAQNQYYILGWDYEWNKISKKHPLKNPEDIYEGIIKRLEKKETFKDKHLVILMHDDMFDNQEDAEQLRKLIRLLKNNKKMVFEVASNYPISLS